ncbi:rhodanese [Paracoccus tegillarcae]|uniref:Rhodanese n=1 Tax=Paracoccus tegillarcae TaxID=1529068 RepID=A0A2K9EWH5_9RHOB|nr:rhodanese [Paracoccus tegillarcae]
MRAAIVFVAILAGAAAGQDMDLYRGPPYNAPVPDQLDGTTTIDGEQAVALHDQGVAFVDVYPRTAKPDDLPEGTIWQEPRHDTIPGAIWLYDTGFVRLSDAEQARLENGLRLATEDDTAAPVVIFCRADCWMSWNAAKRAVALGYTDVHWFSTGTEGWEAASGADLVKAEPADP